MPLFTFECAECGHQVEKFLHKINDDEEVICEKCGAKCTRQFSLSGSRVWQDAKTLYNEKIASDVKKIRDNINKGKDKDFFDVYGDK
jgi:putative FmdB family regulatory protein